VKDQVTIWEGDASKIVSQYLTHSSTRIIMNHPTKSHEFIPTAIQALTGDIGILHYYTFTKEEYPMTVTTQAFRDLVARHDAIVSRIETVRRVREIAPFTWQIVIDAEIMRKNQ
jgi:tRNA G37 N-methylase Trm5